MKIKKRDGRLEEWNMFKVEAAVTKAVHAVAELCMTDHEVDKIHEGVHDGIIDLLDTIKHEGREVVDIEAVQDRVEYALMEKAPAVAKAYVLYRHERAADRDRRALLPVPGMVADYIHPAKYGKWRPEWKRREVYHETVERTFAMHEKKFPGLEMKFAKDAVLAKRVLPSMRSMQFAGERIELHNAAMFNCSSTLCDRPRVFAETFYLLLCGCGVGMSVQRQHVKKLPVVRELDTSKVLHYEVVDNIIGWADCIDMLMDSAYEGYWLEVNYSRIRPEGTVLHKSGGRAPGHKPLRDCVERVRDILVGAAGRHLTSLECSDIVCWIATAVLSGGIRRSSLNFLFTPDDELMLNAKSSAVFRYPRDGDPGLNPQRQMSNNSAVCLKGSTSKETFDGLFDLSMKSWGDPGIAWTEDLDYTFNPCFEIGQRPWITTLRLSELTDDKTISDDLPKDWWEVFDAYHRHTGWSFCNLVEINIAACRTEREFLDACRAAAFIGTLQASYTDMPYLGPLTMAIARDEALLGVGLTGIMDNPKVGLDGRLLRTGAEVVGRMNAETAQVLGIKQGARLTCVKPSGTASLELGGVGSGIHPHHAGRYFRRITANKLEPVANYLYGLNPHMFEVKPNGDWSIIFPVAAPDGAVTVKSQDAKKFLDSVFIVYENWVKPGCVRPESAPGLMHNVSATVTAWPGEWADVRKILWERRAEYNAISFAHAGNDKGIPFMPREEVVTDEDWVKWEKLIKGWVDVDYSKMVEVEDGSQQVQDPACVGGACDVDSVMVEGGVVGRGKWAGCVMWMLDGDEHWEYVEADPAESVWKHDGDWWQLASEKQVSATGKVYCWVRAIRGPRRTELERGV